MNRAFIFPGQGAQAVGMGKDLYDNFTAARDVFQEIDESLKQNLSQIIFDGPSEELTKTENTQPALMAVSMAFLKVIESETKKEINELCGYVAGHSVGEYSALCAAEVIDITTTATILRIRGNAMQNACPKAIGAMAACLGLTMAQIEALVKLANEVGICDIANDNNPSQVVVSGEEKAIDFLAPKIQELGGRCIKLNVSGPFHSRLMVPAEIVMKKALDQVSFNAPKVPVIINVTANLPRDVEEIKNSLITQISGRVRWTETIEYFKSHNVSSIVEIGSGKVLSGLLKKVEHNFSVFNVGNVIELNEFLRSI